MALFITRVLVLSGDYCVDSFVVSSLNTFDFISVSHAWGSTYEWRHSPVFRAESAYVAILRRAAKRKVRLVKAWSTNAAKKRAHNVGDKIEAARIAHRAHGFAVLGWETTGGGKTAHGAVHRWGLDAVWSVGQLTRGHASPTRHAAVLTGDIVEVTWKCRRKWKTESRNKEGNRLRASKIYSSEFENFWLLNSFYLYQTLMNFGKYNGLRLMWS